MLQEIHVGFKDYTKEVIKGKTYYERKEIFWRCYAVEPRKEEVYNLTLDDMIEYIKETDCFWKDDKKHVEACKYLIEEML